MNRLVILPLLFVGVVGASLAHAQVNPPTKEEIDAAKKAAVAYLLSIIQADRAWEPPDIHDQRKLVRNRESWAVSSMVALALVEAGQDPSKTPKFKKAIDDIAAAKTSSVRAMGLRIELLANPNFKGKYNKIIAEDQALLGAATKNGLFGDTITPNTRGRLHSSYEAWCGLSNTKTPDAAWRLLMQTLISSQDHTPKTATDSRICTEKAVVRKLGGGRIPH